jgi:hypothetical protein
MVSLSEIAQQRTVRLIPTCYYKPPVLRVLADNEAEERILAAYEGRTSRRLSSPSLLGDFEGWGRAHIDAAFHYTRKPEGSRFNGPERGAWYAGFDDRTAIEEVAFHRTRELRFTNKFVDEAQYNALHASFIGRFHDIRGHGPSAACLDPDTAPGYKRGQELAAILRADGSRGLIYPSVRYPTGTCLVAFQPNVIQDVAPGAKWKLVWNGSPEWTATVV